MDLVVHAGSAGEAGAVEGAGTAASSLSVAPPLPSAAASLPAPTRGQEALPQRGRRGAANAPIDRRSHAIGTVSEGGRCLWLALAAALCAGPAAAQPAGCRTTTFIDPPREVLDCAGVSISAEKGASYRLVDGNRDGRPEAVELREKGVLIEYRGKSRGGFQVLTPHAVASVRGTVWAVDVKATGTAVFVQTGRVGVTRASAAGQGVVLGAGDGVDVAAGGGPLTVNKWAPERRLGLLARFGR